jgi:hypothetical protein
LLAAHSRRQGQAQSGPEQRTSEKHKTGAGSPGLEFREAGAEGAKAAGSAQFATHFISPRENEHDVRVREPSVVQQVPMQVLRL